jgi:hypothetical protein
MNDLSNNSDELKDEDFESEENDENDENYMIKMEDYCILTLSDDLNVKNISSNSSENFITNNLDKVKSKNKKGI